MKLRSIVTLSFFVFACLIASLFSLTAQASMDGEHSHDETIIESDHPHEASTPADHHHDSEVADNHPHPDAEGTLNHTLYFAGAAVVIGLLTWAVIKFIRVT